MNPQRVTINKQLHHGKARYIVRHLDDNKKRRRHIFASRDAAEKHASSLRGDAVPTAQALAALQPAEQDQLLQALRVARERGIQLLDLALGYHGPATAKHSPALGAVIKELIATTTAAGCAQTYVNELSRYLNAFAKGRTTLPIAKLTVADAKGFVEQFKIPSRATVRTRLSALFSHAVRQGYRPDNPCDRLKNPRQCQKTPHILTLEETRKALDWLIAHPRSLAWFALSAFAGLRPEEAQKTHWEQINITEGWIRVEAQTSKKAERRVVYPEPTALLWLAYAKDHGAQLPLTQKVRTADRKALRKHLGWPVWKQDVTRHSAASYWLAESASAATVATALGHSETILRTRYMALVTKAEANEYFSMLPPGAIQGPHLPTVTSEAAAAEPCTHQRQGAESPDIAGMVAAIIKSEPEAVGERA
jgi:integrase